MSSPTGIRAARSRAPRIPDPYIVPRGDDRFDVACRSCAVKVWCLPHADAALQWARRHRCHFGQLPGERTMR